MTPADEAAPAPPSQADADTPLRVGVVAIGRNEGQRLERCLRALVSADPADGVEAVVYVDSGSTDGSVAFAESLGVAVVELDLDRPFTAARARNAGVAALDAGRGRFRGGGAEADASVEPPAAYFFIDGDCELVPGFLAAAAEAMRGGGGAGPGVVAVGGRRRERFRDASPYNRLCDMEWDRPTGEVTFFGGEGLVDRSAFHAVGGFDGTLIAGEEPELCLRLRKAGGRIWTVDHDVAVHDADMHQFGQWWKRAERAGHAYAEGHAVNRAAGDGSAKAYYAREVRSILAYGLGVPAWVVGLTAAGLASGAWWLAAAGGAGLLAYPVLFWRVYRFRRSRGDGRSDASLYARYTVLGKFAGLMGLLRYRWNRLRGTRQVLMEYKAPAGGAA